MLGTRHEAVQQGVFRASTLSPEKIGKLLMLLTPVVLMALAHKRKQEGATAQHPQLGGMLGGLINQVIGRL